MQENEDKSKVPNKRQEKLSQKNFLPDYSNLKELLKFYPIDTRFFIKNEKTHKIDLDFDQVNSTLQIIENSKKGLYRDFEHAPKYEPQQQGKINLQTLKQRIKALNPQYLDQDIQNLFPPRQDTQTATEVYEFLKQNDIIDFDPLNEALSFFMETEVDKDGNVIEEFISFNKLNNIMVQFGYDKLDKKDIEILRQNLCRNNNDDRISKQDLKELLVNITKLNSLK